MTKLGVIVGVTAWAMLDAVGTAAGTTAVLTSSSRMLELGACETATSTTEVAIELMEESLASAEAAESPAPTMVAGSRVCDVGSAGMMARAEESAREMDIHCCTRSYY